MKQMRRVPLYLILTVCAFVACERKNSAARALEPSPPPPSPTPVQSIAAPSAQPSQVLTSDFTEVAKSVRPAVIIVSVFDETGEWFDVTPALPKTSAGAPVIDQRGEVIGIVSFRAGNNSCAIRPAATAGALLAQVSSNMTATWQTLTTSSHLTTPTASATATRSPTPAKIPPHGPKLIYAPVPRYPAEARRGAAPG